MALNNPYALSFDGVDDYATFPKLGIFGLDQDFTIEVWVKAESVPAGENIRQIIVPLTEGYWALAQTRTGFRAIQVYDIGLWRIIDAEVDISAPHHLSFIKSGDFFSLLVDADVKGSMGCASTLYQEGSVNYVCTDLWKRRFHGIVDELRIWDHARTQAQIQENMHKTLTGTETGLELYYRFDTGSGSIAVDSSPNGYHGEIVGATWIPGEIDLTPTEHLSLFSPLDITLTAKAKSYIGLGVSSLPATNIGSKSMTLNGKLKGLGNYAGAECNFQYYPVDQYKNYALKFDGVDDRISFNKAIIPTNGGPWTISFMAKIDSLSTGQSSVISQYAPESDNRFSIHANFDSGYWSMVQEPALGVVDIAPIVLGEIAYITVSYDGEKLKCYKNDICVTTVEISNLEILDLPTLIGNRNRTGYNDTFNGIIDELSVWSRALSKEEIEEHLHQELTGAEEGLIAYYRFNEGEGDILHDCSRNYNDGIIHGAQWVDSPFKLMPPKEKLERIKGLSFDGIDDYVQIPKEALVFNNSPRTYSIYFKADKTLQTSMHILAYGEGDIGKAFGLQLAANGILYLNLYGGNNIIQLFQTNWEGWVDLVYDGTTLKVYYNGEKTFGQNININTGLSGYGHLGHRFYHDPHWYKGIISEFRSFNYALSELELAAYRYRQLSGNERGLLGYYKMSEEQDNVLIDYSDNNNHGTIYGATWKDEELKVLAPSSLQETPPQKIYSPYTLVKTVTPKEVNGLYFDGVNDRVTISHNALLKPTRITLMAWVEKDDWSDNDINNSKIISCTQTGGYGLQVNRNNGDVGIIAYIGGGYRNAYAPKPASGKHFICGTYDGKYLRTYIDGELAKETAYSGSISYSVNNAVMIGAEPDSGSNAQEGYYFKGKISNVSIWNRAITAEEVKYYYENGLKGNEHGLIVYYKMDEGEGNKIYNSSLYKNEYNLDGTISGATWDIVSLPETKYEYKPGVKFSSIITPGEYKPISGVIKGLRFDGVDDYVLFGNDSIFRSNLTSITIEAIIKPEKVSGTSFIFDVGFYGNKGYGLSISDSWVTFRTPTDYGGATLRSTTNINTGSIYYVTCVLDGESDLMKIYINGVLEKQVAVSPSLVLNSTTVTTDDSATKARIGSQAKASYRSERFFKGELYQFRFWNRALSDEEIALYYNKRITQDFPGLVINYSFDKDIGGNVLVDSSPSYNHGAIYGAQRINADVPLYSIDREPSGTRYYYRAVAKGLPDYALVFNGTSSYATTGIDTLALQDLFDISIDFIAYDFNSLDSIGNRLITALRQNGTYTRWAIGAQDGKIAFLCRLVDSPENLQQTGSVLQKNTLYNVRVVYDGSLTKIYLNGVLDIEINGRIVSDSYDKIALGILPYGTGELKRCWFGEIRKVSFWNRIRTDDEVTINNSIIVGNEPGLVAYYRIVEGEGNVLVDHSPNGKHGTIYGATWVQL